MTHRKKIARIQEQILIRLSKKILKKSLIFWKNLNRPTVFLRIRKMTCNFLFWDRTIGFSGLLVFWFISFSGFSGLPLLKLGLRASAVCMFMSLMVSLVSWFIGLLVNWFSGILKSLANEPENRKTWKPVNNNPENRRNNPINPQTVETNQHNGSRCKQVNQKEKK